MYTLRKQLEELQKNRDQLTQAEKLFDLPQTSFTDLYFVEVSVGTIRVTSSIDRIVNWLIDSNLIC